MPTIMKNGIAYGGAADQADLILATDLSGNDSNVQTELNKLLNITAGSSDAVDTVLTNTGTWYNLATITLDPIPGLYLISFYAIFKPSSTTQEYTGIIGTSVSNLSVVSMSTSKYTGVTRGNTSKEGVLLVRIPVGASTPNTFTLRGQSNYAEITVTSRVGYATLKRF